MSDIAWQPGDSLRPLREGEASLLRRLIHRTIDSSYGGVYPPRAVRFFKLYHAEQKILLRQEEGEVLVLGKEGGLAATGSLVGCEILGVFVDPLCQGKGYGRHVMARLEAMARARGCRRVSLSVSLPSRGFYEALGYQLKKERAMDVGQGQRLRYWPAEKYLADG